MDRVDIKEFHFITYIDNVPSISRLGIVSRNKAVRDKVQFKCIAQPGVPELRKKNIPGTSRELHDYANLYFDAHNPMLSRIRSENDHMCVLQVSRDVLELPGVIVIDMNAARNCRFMSVYEGLDTLDREDVYRVNWKDPKNAINEYRQAGIKCAEILVPACVEPRYITGAYVANQSALEAFRRVCCLTV